MKDFQKKQDRRKVRLAQALRTNLLRRKVQMRERQAAGRQEQDERQDEVQE